ncbi:DsbA family protein [Phaeovulum sp. W22_SRMD_FR3]|uniref:DsbA family protein n=1 Tax=Phaeovulum sp. W22_SRMD_FR3 TaxID=3240274 RepID=UPI003F9818C9
MIRTTLAAFLVSAMQALPALAFDPAAMNDGEKDAFGQAVRDYLMTHPEVLVEAINELETRQASAAAQNDQSLVQDNSAEIFSDGHSWVGGNPEGDITVVEFMDYRCGYCRKAYQEVEDLVSSDGNIRFILKEFPILGPQSDLSARYAIAVQQLEGDEAYKKTHDALINFRGDITNDSLSRMATDMGFDAAAVLKRMGEDSVTNVLAANHQLAEKLRISGTPTFVMGGQMVRGYVPLDGMRQIVTQERG